MEKNNGLTNSKTIVTETALKCEPSKNEIESLEEQGRLRLLLDIFLEADLKNFQKLINQT